MSLKSNFEYIRDWCNHRFLRRDEKVDVDLSNYYTKDEVDSNISSATPDISVSMYSSSGSKSYSQTISNNGQFQLSRVATSGSYNDLSNKPTIPAAQVQSDWNATSGMGVILNKPDLSGYMTVEDYQTDEEVVAAALNDLDGRIKSIPRKIISTWNEFENDGYFYGSKSEFISAFGITEEDYNALHDRNVNLISFKTTEQYGDAYTDYSYLSGSYFPGTEGSHTICRFAAFSNNALVILEISITGGTNDINVEVQHKANMFISASMISTTLDNNTNSNLLVTAGAIRDYHNAIEQR